VYEKGIWWHGYSSFAGFKYMSPRILDYEIYTRVRNPVEKSD
jgi:hypothetical protein